MIERVEEIIGKKLPYHVVDIRDEQGLREVF